MSGIGVSVSSRHPGFVFSNDVQFPTRLPRHFPSQKYRLIHVVQKRPRWIARADPDVSSGEAKNEPDDTFYIQPENEPTAVGKFFGSYLQLGVWVVVLSFAGYKGIMKAQTDPSSVGLLLAPPAGALFLIVTFLIYRFRGKNDTDEV